MPPLWGDVRSKGLEAFGEDLLLTASKCREGHSHLTPQRKIQTRHMGAVGELGLPFCHCYVLTAVLGSDL